MPPHVVIDGFLPDALRQGMLDLALADEARFEPTEVRIAGEGSVADQTRRSWIYHDKLGPFTDAFLTAVQARETELMAMLATPPFPVARREVELVVHRDGSFYKPHIDTFTDPHRGKRTTDRVLTLVYYFHAQPRQFSGGDLTLYPFGTGTPKAFEARDNRLLAFPSFAVHEVQPIVCENNAFANARFAVNCWLHRPRQPT